MWDKTLENLANKPVVVPENRDNATDVVIEDTTKKLSDMKDTVVKTKTDELSAKVDANTDRPTRKELRDEKKELREERRDDKQLDRLIGRLNKEIAKTSVVKQELNKTTGEYNLLMMNLEDLRNFNDYLMKVRNKKIDPATEKFQPQNLESFLAMLMQMPYGKWYIDFVAKDGKRARVGGSSIDYWVVQWSSQSGRKSWGLQFQNIDTSDDATFWEAYTEHGLRWLIKKGFDYMPNMTENQKDWRTNALFLWGMGYGLFKLGKRFFTWAKNEKWEKVWPWFLWRLAIAWWVFLWSNMLTGKSPIELIDKALNGWMSREYLKWERFKWADGAAKLEKEQYVYPLTVSTIFWKTKIADLWNALDDGFKIKDYDALLQKAKADWNQEVVDMLNRVWKWDKDSQIKQWLEQLWIKKDNLTTFWDKTVDDLKKIYDANLAKALKYKTENDLMQDIDDKEKVKAYNDLMGSWKEITDDDLKKLVEDWVLYEQFELKKDSNREALKNKVDKLEDGKSLKIKIGDDDAELSKINWISEIELKSKNGKVTKINLDWPSIIWLWDWEDRPFVDKEGNPDFYATIISAHKLNGFKNTYLNRKVAAWNTPFTFENWKIYFNESKTWTTEINKVEVMDSWILWLFSDFPDIFEWQEQQIVDYLNKEINTQNQALEEVIKTFNSNNIQMELVWWDLKSHWEITKIDVANKKIIWLDDSNWTWPNRQFKNYSELVWWANLINFFKKFLRNRPAESTERPIYIWWVDGNIAFNDRTIFQEMRSYANRGANWFWDSDLVQSGELFFRKANSLKNISPTLYDHRTEFVHRLNNNWTFQEKISESTERTKLKEKVNNLQNTDKLKVQIGDDSIELQKSGSLSSVNVISSEWKTTTVNFENATIKWLWFTNWTTVVDRKFTDSEWHNNYLELLVTANALNNIKNKYEDKIYAAWLSAPWKNPGFKYESKDKKIYFNESKEWWWILQDEAMDDGMFFSDFPESFKWQENQIVTYLNNEVLINPESPDRVLEYFKSRGMDIILTNPAGPTTDVESYGYSTTIDLKNKKLDTLGRQFTNHLELIWAANLVNLVSKILADRNALAKDGVYIWFDWNIAFDDKTIWEEIKTYSNKWLHGYGDVDLIRSWDLLFRQKNTLRSISPTLAANRREFVNYLNNNRTYSLETRQLQEKKARIEKSLNNGMRTPINFADGGMTYNEETKELTITAINEDSLSNDQMVNNNLDNVENFVSRYNILQSEDVKKIILPEINLEPGKSVSVKYLKKLLDLDEKKIQLWPDFLANREMIEFVAKKYDEWKFIKEANSKIDMNWIITLNYIYDSWYDFNRLFNWEDDSRIDFAMRVMELLAWHRTIVDPTKKSIVELDKNIVKTPIKLPAWDDPIMKIRRIAKWENIDFGFSQNKKWRKNADNIDIMNEIIKNIHRYATQNPPIENVPYIHP